LPNRFRLILTIFASVSTYLYGQNKDYLKKFLRKSLKILLWILGGIITLLLVLLLLIQIPSVQNFIKNKAVSFIEDKIETPVRIDNLEIGFPKKIILSGFYFEDQNQDTLAAGERLAVNIDFYKLLSNTIEISSIELEGATVNISRNQDSIFNFDYIVEAFATAPTQDTTAAMAISIGTVDLDRVRFSWNDEIIQSDIKANINHLDGRVGIFEPENFIYEFPEINVDGLNLRMTQGITTSNPSNGVLQGDTEETPMPDLRLGDLSLKNASISYRSDEAGLDTNFDLKELVGQINELQLEQMFIDISSVEINGLRGSLTLRETANAPVDNQDITNVSAPSNNWRAKLNSVELNNIAFNFRDENIAPTPVGMDYGDLELTNLNLDADDVFYSLDSVSGKINSFTMRDKSGLDIKSLQTEFLYSENAAYLKDLYLETPNTLLQDRIVARYESLESLESEPGEIYIDANLENSRLGFKDVLLLAPDLRNTNPFQSDPNAVVRINGKVEGQLKNLNISNFEASGIGNTSIAISGSIRGLPDAENAVYNLNIRNFRTTSRDLNLFLPPGTIPDSITLPESFTATGNFRGTATNFNTNLDIKSSSGNAVVDANIDMRRENAEVYDARISLDEFDLGRLIQNDSIGTLTLNIEAKGTGFDPATANATASGTIERAEYNSYVYRDLKFEGSVSDGNMTASADMDDPNIDFGLDISGNFQGEYPSLQFEGDLRNVALDSINLYGYPLRLEGKIKADLRTADPDHLNGEIYLTEFIAENGGKRFPLDSITIRSTATAEIDSIIFSSQFLQAKMVGDYQLTQVGTAIAQTIESFYNATPVYDTTTIEPQRFTFEVNLKDDPVLTHLMPDLALMQPVNFSGSYNSATDSLVVNGDIPRMRYMGYRIVNGDVNIETRDGLLAYDIIIEDVEGPQIQLFHTELSGEIKENTISYNLRIDDSSGNPHYKVAGSMETKDYTNRFALEIDNLMLNYDIWNIPEDNSISFGPSGVQAVNFELTHDNNAIRINSQSDDPSSPIDVEFDNFRIETISAMISKDTLLATGTVNGDIILSDLMGSPQFTSELTVDNFTFKRDTVGNLNINVDNLTANTLQANVILTGAGNDVEMAGLYSTDSGNLDFDLDLRQLNVKSIQGFSYGNITEGEGYLSGDLRLEGTATKPVILGELNFNDVGFIVVPLDNYFQNMNDPISFTREGISFNQFTIEDEDNNKMVVNGTLQTSDYASYGFNLTVNADDFRAISSTAEDNEFYYGDLVLDTRLTIGGTLDNPVVRGTLNIKEGTEISVVLPQEDPTIADREGVVEFVDQRSQRLAELRAIEETVNTSALQGMDVSVNIDINEEADFTLIVDEGNGDYLNLRGDAQLTAGIDPSGRTSLTGRYEFTQGAYEMSFNFIRRRFEIQPGSYINWTGEPTTARIDITAIYETETAPIDLLGNQLAGLAQGVRNTYKQEIPFQTILRMQGELLEPELSFDIKLPEGNHNVSSDIINASRAKLAQLRQQPSELNKQVFALLLLNRFIGENPFSSEGGGTSAESLARQSVSKILSQQLNDLAGDLISRVQLEFDLDSTEDYTTGQREQRTDLNVGLSRTLLNDRLKVTVGSSFGLEGPQQSNQQANNIAGDIAVDYQLSKDGRYRLRAYRKNQYQVALQGQIVETGIAFIITMDYDKFMEIFGKTPGKDEE